MIDSHCHLTHRRLVTEFDALVARAREAGLVACVTIGTGVEDARQARDLAARAPGFLFCAAGLDPFSAHRAADSFDGELTRLKSLLKQGGYCALGEIGLDYYHDLDPHDIQAVRFERQLELAAALDLPVVIHVREAHADMLAILAAHPRCRGVIHSFTAGPREADSYLQLGWHLSFNGVVTYGKGSDLRDAARQTPPDRLLLETDSPYLAPVPLRGKRCEPAHMTHTGSFLAKLRGETLAALGAATTENAARLFGLDFADRQETRTETVPDPPH